MRRDVLEPPSGTVTFLFTDIEGSTRHWERQPAAMADALARHDALLRSSLERHGGYIFKTVGDGCYAAFQDPAAAVTAAIEAQRSLLAEAWSVTGPLGVRMAIHAGVATPREGDYFGPVVNTCARLLGAGHGGQLLASRAVVELLAGATSAGLAWRDLGEQRLRDLDRPLGVYQVLASDLPADFPPLVTRSGTRHNLPVAVTSFIGREREVAQVKERLGQTRLLTLTGIGGTGKTRLALQAVGELLGDFPDGVWFADLAPISDPSRMVPAVAAATGVREEPGRTLLATLTDHLHGRRVLLVLDNCEHLAAPCADLVDHLLRHAPAVSLLATSRVPLGVAGEHLLTVPPLARPEQVPARPSEDTIAVLHRCESVRLFAERARAVCPEFVVTGTNAAAVAEVCRRLDGIPLAIELAAARVTVLSVPQIAERLDQRFALLTGGSRTGLARQHTLRAAMDWSWELLGEDERTLLQRLSVFMGGWNLDAAECVATREGIEAVDVLDLLGALVAHSLVAMHDLDGEARYRLLETVRAYGWDKAESTGQAERLRQRHAAFFADLASRAEPELKGPHQAAWLVRLERDHDNLTAALGYLRARDEAEVGLRMATDLYRFWLTRTCWAEGREHIAALLALPSARRFPAACAKALYTAGVLARHQDDRDGARTLAEAALSTWRSVEHADGITDALNLLGIIALRWDRDPIMARQRFEEVLVRRRAAGDQRGVAVALFNLATIASDHDNDLAAARALLDESLAILHQLGDRSGIAATQLTLGSLADLEGDYETARSLFSASLATNRELGDKALVANSLILLGEVAVAEGDLPTARANLEEAFDVAGAVESRWFVAQALADLGNLAMAEGDLQAAHSRLEESLGIARAIGEPGIIGFVLTRLGLLACEQGDHELARRQLGESLQVRVEEGAAHHIAHSLEGLACLAASEGRPERALRLAAAADAVRATRGTVRPPNEDSILGRCLDTARARLPPDVASAAEAAGRALTLEAAVADALSEDEA